MQMLTKTDQWVTKNHYENQQIKKTNIPSSMGNKNHRTNQQKQENQNFRTNG